MKKINILLGLILLFGLGIFFWWNQGQKPVNTKNASQKIFVVKKGQSVREIATSLKAEGLIRDTVVFFLLVKQLGIEEKIQAGDFRLSPSQSAKQIAENLTHGTLDAWITIPEGKRAEEIAELLEKSIPTYQKSWKAALRKHEGFLFPDTYLIPTDTDIDTIINILTNHFNQQFAKIQINTPNSFSKEDLVIIASLIEREARFQKDRPLIASVIHNRLDMGMKLDIDATIQYALGYQQQEKTWWKRHLTLDDLKLASSYNTYRNPGLPPAPIANPGFAALEAAANPAKTNYLYYITDKTGTNRYGRTMDEHNANISKYGL